MPTTVAQGRRHCQARPPTCARDRYRRAPETAMPPALHRKHSIRFTITQRAIVEPVDTQQIHHAALACMHGATSRFHELHAYYVCMYWRHGNTGVTFYAGCVVRRRVLPTFSVDTFLSSFANKEICYSEGTHSTCCTIIGVQAQHSLTSLKMRTYKSV